MEQKFSRDIAKYLPSYIFPAIIGIVSVPIFTRLFSPGDYGNYILAITTVSILVTVSVSWLDNAVVRFYPFYEQKNELNSFYLNSIILALISSSVIAFIFFVVSKSNLFKIVAILFFITAVYSLLTHFLRAQRKASYYSLANVWHSTIGFLLGLMLVIIYKIGISGLLIGHLIAILLILPFLWRNAIGKWFIKGNLSKQKISEFAKYGMPIMISNLGSWGIIFCDRYILKFYRESDEVGIYSASYTIAERGGMLIISLLMLAALPIIFSIWEKRGEIEKFMQNLTISYAKYAIFLFLILFTLRRILMKVFAGPSFYQAYTIIPLIAISSLFYGFHRIVESGLWIHKKTNIAMRNTIMAFVFNFLLNILFVPKYGYLAAGITTAASYLLWLFLTVITSSKYFRWRFPCFSLLKIIIASSIGGFSMSLFSNRYTGFALLNLIYSILIGGVVYILLLYVFRELTREEKA